MAAVYLVAAVLLGAAGAAKAVVPEAASATLARLGLYHRQWAVRLLGLAELVVATGAFIVGGIVPATALAALYASFAVVVAAMLRSGTDVPCGCFGPIEMPATKRHLAVNISATAAGLLAAAWPVEPFDKLFDSHKLLLALLATAVATGAYATFTWLRK